MKKTIIYVLILLVLLIGAGFYLDVNENEYSSQGGVLPLSSLKKNSGSDVELNNYGPAPEFAAIEKWLNSDPLTMANLQGKVVLIDFWTYSCINCIRTLPYITGWYEKYKDKGFVVVGVHTPEFAFEKDTANVQTALKRHKINYPVAQDNNYGTWNAYSNRYWPAKYLIDQNGDVVYTHFGEGKYQETEQAIQKLLGQSQEKEMAEENTIREVKTPEIYFGLKRLDKNYAPELLGQWQSSDESAKLVGTNGAIRLNFYAQDVHMVARSDSGAVVKVFIDGKRVDTLEIKESKLYTLFEGVNSKPRVLELEIEGAGFEAFTFTFG